MGGTIPCVGVGWGQGRYPDCIEKEKLEASKQATQVHSFLSAFDCGSVVPSCLKLPPR